MPKLLGCVLGNGEFAPHSSLRIGAARYNVWQLSTGEVYVHDLDTTIEKTYPDLDTALIAVKMRL